MVFYCNLQMKKERPRIKLRCDARSHKDVFKRMMEQINIGPGSCNLVGTTAYSQTCWELGTLSTHSRDLPGFHTNPLHPGLVVVPSHQHKQVAHAGVLLTEAAWLGDAVGSTQA